MLSRFVGVLWIGIGIICVGLAGSWMVLEDRLVNAIPQTIIPVLGILASMISVPVWVPPPYGAQVTLIVGVFFIVLGTRLTIGMAGTRIVAAFIHVVLGICLLALTFLLFTTASIPWPSSNMRYAVCGGVFILALGLFGSATALYQLLDDPFARGWTPFAQCVKCGRKLNASKQCPIHDVKILYPRLIDQARQKIYPILSGSKPILIGRSQEAGVWFDETFEAAYKQISREHARIGYDQDRQEFFIITLGSNSVLVAEQPVSANSPTLLPRDAIVKLGGVPFVFQVKEWYQAEVDREAKDVRYALD